MKQCGINMSQIPVNRAVEGSQSLTVPSLKFGIAVTDVQIYEPLTWLSVPWKDSLKDCRYRFLT